ncbi:DapH/DapD/GlmU-related protein [Galbibacter sp. EGI 63066]|uniref:DapH/DapD/GlmU-related protein n=1 Tax=Galbibacter sp. EGI 63066 TaxID=2993559 RepID=UPI0022499445|nr:DapH/DapD/GlmU-related protein [Galbibacter sp. EGI 63066]MCX2680157.1 DapH/DapD/GlmU-related protein [Galbibacter sp. EGI 63066]
MDITDFISNFPFDISTSEPWKITSEIKERIETLIQQLDSEFDIENGIAIHKTATIEKGVTMKAPLIINAHCRIGAHSYFREGVFLGTYVNIGPSSEIKSSIICSESAIAHMNYVGNSIIGSRVNFEAGSIAANHYNERDNKEISIKYKGEIQSTGLNKFGSIVGDDSKIGANAVLSPGTILEKRSVVKRLELVDQISI